VAVPELLLTEVRRPAGDLRGRRPGFSPAGRL